MLALDRLNFSGLRDKGGLSNLIAYVLLVAISLSLSILVYGWLKFYVGGAEALTCPSGVNLVIDSYECYSRESGNLTVTIKNKGLFDVAGYVLRVHDREDAEFGIYTFNDTGAPLGPGEKHNMTYVFSDFSFGLTNVKLVDIQPFVDIDGEIVSCESFSSQRTNCIKPVIVL